MSPGDGRYWCGVRGLVRRGCGWVLDRLLPPTGRRRRCTAVAGWPLPAAGPAPGPLPAHRSPYAERASDTRPWVMDGKPLVRPYFLAHERERAAWMERRLAGLALGGAGGP
ncbi:hypothetical protein [Streptomyces daliensis]|uniref:Uncharacterized protein n=1 Tax=Streptomyces daliensis TaxID=299421 RepID=A0A8T4IWL3_9ACTN|nr:hypothetical protein [Streptomyces daliensis]